MVASKDTPDLPFFGTIRNYRKKFTLLVLFLLLHQQILHETVDGNFKDAVNFFVNGDYFWSRSILNSLFDYSIDDTVLFPDLKRKKYLPNEREVYISISGEYIKQEFFNGIEIPNHYSFFCDLGKLTKLQRQKLWTLPQSQRRNKIPNPLFLYLPKYNNERKQIYATSDWHARINPLISSPEEIFNAWENDYDKALEEAQKEQEKALKEGEENNQA